MKKLISGSYLDFVAPYIVKLPDFNQSGNLPPGIFEISVSETIEHFRGSTHQRNIVSQRLERIYEIAKSTGYLKHFVVFGSFVTSKPEPNDIDIFMIMSDTFDVTETDQTAKAIFDHNTAHSVLGASVFWIRSMAALGGEEDAMKDWMVTREGDKRGVLKIVE